jgi:hypothetical protein
MCSVTAPWATWSAQPPLRARWPRAHPARRLVRQPPRADDPERRGVEWFGAMEPRELWEIAPSLGISPEERDHIEKAAQGEGLLVTRPGRRVWVNLYGHRSPA